MLAWVVTLSQTARKELVGKVGGKSFLTDVLGRHRAYAGSVFHDGIGWTWIDPNRQRTYINTEAKFLMLRHAFEVWKCVRVELKTDVLNVRSQQAMARIGAVREGILRRHMITASGRRRDSVYFSVIDEEWPTVRQNFVEKLLKQ